MAQPLDVRREFESANFGDFRLSQRLLKLTERLASNPDISFPKLLDVAELEAAYRFFNNEKVTAKAILAPHIRATRDRIGDGRLIVAHDTTTVSFRNGGKRVGLGTGAKGNQVLHAHVSLAITELGAPLGVLATSTHAGVAATEQHGRWLEQALAIEREVGVGRVVHVMDREADDYELFAGMLAGRHRFVVRAAHNRALTKRNGGQQREKLFDLVPTTKPLTTREVTLSPRTGQRRGSKSKQVHPVRSGRIVKLAFAARRVELIRAAGTSSELPESIALNVVRVWELAPVQGEPSVQWVLLTNEPIDDADDVLAIVDAYRSRWVIEELFKALKTGCAVEKRQLETRSSLEKALAIFLPIAWSLLGLRTALRTGRDKRGENLLPPVQMALLREIAERPLPKHPSVQEIVYAIARLGGHLPRNGDPGWLSLSDGYQRLLTLAQGTSMIFAALKIHDQS
jgi:hypothetical protein